MSYDSSFVEGDIGHRSKKDHRVARSELYGLLLFTKR